MIKVQLLRNNWDVHTQTVGDGRAANRVIDALINDVHQGRHGEGQFLIFADHVNELGLFVGLFYRSQEFSHPVINTIA